MIKSSSMQSRSRSYSTTVLKDTFRRWGARVGLIWLIFLVCIAVFAPFIANSHPILVSHQGQLYSPLMSHLSFADIGILAAFFVSILIFKVRLKIHYKFLIVISFSFFSALIFLSLLDAAFTTRDNSSYLLIIWRLFFRTSLNSFLNSFLVAANSLLRS